MYSVRISHPLTITKERRMDFYRRKIKKIFQTKKSPANADDFYTNNILFTRFQWMFF